MFSHHVRIYGIWWNHDLIVVDNFNIKFKKKQMQLEHNTQKNAMVIFITIFPNLKQYHSEPLTGHPEPTLSP